MLFDRRTPYAVILTLALTIGCGGTHVAYQAEEDVAKYHVAFAVDPLIIGEQNEATVTLTRGSGAVEDAVVTLRLSMPQMTMPDEVVTLQPQGRGRYTGQVRFTMSGNWIARVAAHRRGDTDVRTQFVFGARDR